ncbi:MAG: hypothetical protein Kow00127_00490 [Bacteroidales bacterium]
MPTKIRLQRHGKKGKPFYHIVIADGRAPRDGKFIEKIGTYNPLTKPAEINLRFDRALYWLQSGAQPTDTVRAILSYKGVLYKNHLLKGVKKGALTEEQAEAKFDAWLKDKEARIAGVAKEVEEASREERKKRIEAERKINEERARELAAKRAEELKAEMPEEEKEEQAEEAAEAPAEETEAAVEAKEETSAEEAAPEAPAEEEKPAEAKAEEKAEPADEAPAEAKAEEPEQKPAEEASPEEEKKED